uniref:Uncharacterized protein n=1 Tax=uncultured Prevotella sp. TaxID=159272 RepID=A0A6G8F1Q5_9BACT|nr:hypothetical protein Prevot485_2760 [uncultured Prevotella sp.]
MLSGGETNEAYRAFSAASQSVDMVCGHWGVAKAFKVIKAKASVRGFLFFMTECFII